MKRRTVLTEAEADQVADVLSQHRTFVENVARQHSSHPKDVPDIIQEVAVRVCQSLNGFRGESEIQTWLYRVTVSAAVDHYRSERRQGRVRERVAAIESAGNHHTSVYVPNEQDLSSAIPEVARTRLAHRPNYEEQVHTSQRLTALKDAVERLRPRQQEVMRDELSGSSVKNSKATRHRAIQRLRTMLATDPRLG